MKLLTDTYLPTYLRRNRVDIPARLAQLTELRNGGGRDLLRVYESAVASSQIEGSKVTLRVFLATLKAAGDRPKPKDIQEVYDLVKAYDFAKGHALTLPNLLKAHAILSEQLVNANDRGAWRSKGVKVGNAYTTVYLAPHQTLVPALMEQLLREVKPLLKADLPPTEVFYYAALLHLAFVKVHPFIDGNGRMGRLLEKWFLAQHLGPIAWSIRSERFYIRNLDSYYGTLAALGKDWGTMRWEKCVPFTLLLPRSLR